MWMGWFDRFEQWVFWGITTVVATLVGGVGYLVRQVFTDAESIRMLKKEIEHRDQLRAEDREAMEDIRDSVIRIEDVLIGRRDRQ